MKFSDIQIADKTLWNQVQQAWANGDYTTALNIMNNAQLKYKILNAQALNETTSKLVEVEQLNDPTYANDRIKVERQVPTDLKKGEVYFDWTNPPPYTFAEVDALNYTFEDVDNLGITWGEADKGGW